MTAHKLALAALAAAGLFVACEELPDDSALSEASEVPEMPEAAPPQAPPDDPSSSGLQLEGPGLFELGAMLRAASPAEGEGIPAEIEEAPERVDWTLSETALRHYVDWQRHLEDAQALAQVALRVVSDETYPEALRKRAAEYAEPESPDSSFARFGLSRDEVVRAEQLSQELAFLRESLVDWPSTTPELRGRAGSAERQFLAALDDHQQEALREAAAPLRARFGDANVDLLLRYQASLPAYPQFLSDSGEAEAEALPEAEAEAGAAAAEDATAALP